MSRGNPERIYLAHRAGIFRRLVDAERVTELDAEHWISRWEREAEASGRQRDNHLLVGWLELDRGGTAPASC